MTKMDDESADSESTKCKWVICGEDEDEDEDELDDTVDSFSSREVIRGRQRQDVILALALALAPM